MVNYKWCYLLLLFAMLFAGCKKEQTFNLIQPLPSGMKVDSLTDCCVPASFSIDDFNWRDGDLMFTVYNEDLYDAVEVNNMQVGDTILFDGDKLHIDIITKDSLGLTINYGIEEGGCWLLPYEGGTYRAVQFDDHSYYTELGATTIPLAEDFVIIDCGENPTDPSDTISANQRAYLESVKPYKREFSPLDTKVLIENGVVTQINRRWIP